MDSEMITDIERQKALELLVRSRQALLDAVEGVTEQQAHWKPAPERWSILECSEQCQDAHPDRMTFLGEQFLHPICPQ